MSQKSLIQLLKSEYFVFSVDLIFLSFGQNYTFEDVIFGLSTFSYVL